MRLLLWALAAFTAVHAVKPEDFKTCAQSSFCRRLKGIARRHDENPSTFESPYTIEPPSTGSSLSESDSLIFPISSSLYPQIRFELRVDILEKGDGIVRLRMDELNSSTPFRRYNETARWALLESRPSLSKSHNVEYQKGKATINYGPPDSHLSLEIQYSPFKITQYRGRSPEVILNDRSLFHMEHFRIKDVEKQEEAEILGEREQMVLKGGEMDRAWFEESDKDSFQETFRQWTDSKPKGQKIT